jgi:transcriptional regulator with XRE-family HTH domain
MKERLIQLLDLEQLSPSKFADLIGVQRSSISHVISGRNKPSYDFLQKTLKAFPGLNASWLLLGEGTMYEQMGRKVSGNLFDTQESAETPLDEQIPESGGPDAGISSAEEPGSGSLDPETLPESTEISRDKEKQTKELQDSQIESSGKKRIVQIMVIYEDDTFKSFMPAN